MNLIISKSETFPYEYKNCLTESIAPGDWILIQKVKEEFVVISRFESYEEIRKEVNYLNGAVDIFNIEQSISLIAQTMFTR